MTTAATPFVILATQRTGSSWVAGMLGSHPTVGTYGELFDRRGKDYPVWGRSDIRYLAAYSRDRGPRRDPVTRASLCFSYLNELYSPRDGLEAIGFKLMYSHVKETPAVFPYICAKRVRVVHLVRTNLLDIIISDDTARARGSFHSTGPDPDQVTVSLDPATVLARLRALDRQVRVVRRALALTRTPTIEVAYEQLVADPRAFGDVLRFLEVDEPGRDLSSKLQKLNRLTKEQIIDNYGEIESALRPTRFAALLD
jgi:LPS sulfotransferase NodH